MVGETDEITGGIFLVKQAAGGIKGVDTLVIAGDHIGAVRFGRELGGNPRIRFISCCHRRPVGAGNGKEGQQRATGGLQFDRPCDGGQRVIEDEAEVVVVYPTGR